MCIIIDLLSVGYTQTAATYSHVPLIQIQMLRLGIGINFKLLTAILLYYFY